MYSAQYAVLAVPMSRSSVCVIYASVSVTMFPSYKIKSCLFALRGFCYLVCSFVRSMASFRSCNSNNSLINEGITHLIDKSFDSTLFYSPFHFVSFPLL